jgi:NAD(P)-dependent dehydrogenase (short-subunit alcohol dehydrogenase family)
MRKVVVITGASRGVNTIPGIEVATIKRVLQRHRQTVSAANVEVGSRHVDYFAADAFSGFSSGICAAANIRRRAASCSCVSCGAFTAT